MSGGSWDQEHGAYQRPGPLVFFSNPLMSDGASDWSPVHDASFNGRPVALQTLLSQGACANLATLDQVSPLLGACQRGHALCARLLIQNGAHVNSATLDGSTPLSEACAGGHLTCVSLLLQHGATPLGQGCHAPSPIHIAAAKGHQECVSVLVEHGADVDLHRDLSGTPLCAAVANQHLSTVRSLLQQGASVNSSLDGDSPLHTAARLSSPEMVSVLMEHGADCSVRNPQGKRPVDLAPPNSLAERMLGKSRGVPCLKQLCRLSIRRFLDKERMGAICGLDIPVELRDYLLYRTAPPPVCRRV
ncbi:ankyrin repeat and SOCS box protein 9 [Gadus morhua]|uniref:ankyrin repeat and SOCS box protein 9 n=1 Tax=Gadus morhua TaxID=8049 RepID=UPI0011B858A1|nr:ankyrin repeat and SOCS box protein 9-like [Gadus morhua]